MPAPITHIVLAEKVFSKFFSKFNKEEFFIGVVFPDIRYLGVIEKDKTHIDDVTIIEVQAATSSFGAGLLFHCLTDIVFNDFFSKALVKLDNFPGTLSLFKLLADELFYGKINNWLEISDALNSIPSDELGFNINKDNLLKWHDIIKNSLINIPSNKSRSEFMTALNFPEVRIEEVNQMLADTRNNRIIKEVISDFYDNFNRLIL